MLREVYNYDSFEKIKCILIIVHFFVHVYPPSLYYCRLTRDEKKLMKEEEKREKERKRVEKERERERKRKEEIRMKNRQKGIKAFKVCKSA